MKKFYYFGIAAAGVYAFAVTLGGFLWQSYNPISQAISELIMTTSPNQLIMQPLFWLYNVLLLIFSIGFFWWASNRALKTAAVALFLVAFSGVMMLLFPQGVIGEALTTTGLLHLIFAGIAALATLVTMFACVLGFKQLAGYKNLMIVSLALGLVILINGPMTAIAPTAFPQFFGLTERVTIGAFVLWLFITSWTLRKKYI